MQDLEADVAPVLATVGDYPGMYLIALPRSVTEQRDGEGVGLDYVGDLAERSLSVP